MLYLAKKKRRLKKSLEWWRKSGMWGGWLEPGYEIGRTRRPYLPPCVSSIFYLVSSPFAQGTHPACDYMENITTLPASPNCPNELSKLDDENPTQHQTHNLCPPSLFLPTPTYPTRPGAAPRTSAIADRTPVLLSAAAQRRYKEHLAAPTNKR